MPMFLFIKKKLIITEHMLTNWIFVLILKYSLFSLNIIDSPFPACDWSSELYDVIFVYDWITKTFQMGKWILKSFSWLKYFWVRTCILDTSIMKFYIQTNRKKTTNHQRKSNTLTSLMKIIMKISNNWFDFSLIWRFLYCSIWWI